MDISLFNNRAAYEPLVKEINERVGRVIESGRFVLGPEVEAFEHEFARYLGVKHAVGVANGTDAIAIALMAMDVGPGDEVVVPSYTFFATAEAVCHAGAKPVFCDIDPDTYLVTAESVNKVLSDRTRAVIPVHLFGNVAPMDELLELADSEDLAVVEDTAQATGSCIGNSSAGTLGDAGTFSFFPSKNLPCFGDGGAVVTNSDAVAESVRILRLRGSHDKRNFFRVGFNSRLDAIQAAVLRVLIPELDGWNDLRRRVAKSYLDLGIEQYLVPQRVTDETEAALNLFVTTCDRSDRDALIEGMRDAGIETRSLYAKPVHRQQAMQQYSEKIELPVTDHLAEKNLALPMGPGLDRGSIERVVDAVAHLD